jgi:ABC-type multidrug transport system ATPase subunit
MAAVDSIDLDVPSGAVFGFLGPNGAGKTTTIRLLLGLIRPSEGRVEVNGHDLRRERSRALSSVGAIVESPALYPNLTGRETLRLATRLLGRSDADAGRLLDLVELADAADRTIRTYSLGMKQRLALARALVGQPRLLVLDEPMNGLDPAGIAQMRTLIRELPQRFGTTVLLSSHLLSEIEQTADHCALIDAGRLVYQGRLGRLMGSVSPRLMLEADDLSAARQWLVDRGFTADVDGHEVCALAALDAPQRAELVSALVSAGIGISGVRVDRPSLETLFLQMTARSEAVA